jgi:hypothetical protein
MNFCWRNECNKRSISLIKSEIVVKMNYKQTYYDFYTFGLKDKDIQKPAKSNRKCVFKFKY